MEDISTSRVKTEHMSASRLKTDETDPETDPSTTTVPHKSAKSAKSASFSSTTTLHSRRESFLLKSMIDSETSSVYESFSFFPKSQSFNIISLKLSQGFLFNQDLFATPYQQLRSMAREKHIRALSFSKGKRKSPNSTCCSSPNSAKQRRHTSYELKPRFRVDYLRDESAIDDDDDDAMEVDSAESGTRAGSREPQHITIEEFEESDDEFDFHNEALDEVELFEEHYNVPVTEIYVNESDDFLP